VFSFFKRAKTMYFYRQGRDKPEAISFFANQAEDKDGGSILSVAMGAGVRISHSCGGMGSCGTCRVVVLDAGNMPLEARNQIEQEMASDRGFAPDERLACQTSAVDGLKVLIP
jgi:2Fe-2S ferredoxin